MEILLRESEVAEILQVKEGTMRKRRWERRPLLQFVRVGRLIRYRPADVEAFQEANIVPVPESKPER